MFDLLEHCFIQGETIALALPLVVISRLCLALAAIAVQTPNGNSNFLDTVLHMVSQDPQSHSKVMVALQLLTLLAEETTAADVSRNR